MLNYKQCDPKWRDAKIGNSKTSLCKAGCLICSICDIHSKFYYKPESKVKLTPPEAASQFIFTSVSGDPEPHYVEWNLTEWQDFGQKFVERVRTWTDEDIKKVNDYTKKPDYGVVLNVELKKGGQHWVAMWLPGLFGPVCNDPISGSVVWKLTGLLGKYKRILGYAVFSKVN